MATPTIVDLYENSTDGPTIRIDAQDISEVQAIIEAFEQLASQVGAIVDLTSFHNFKFLSSIRSLTLKSTATAQDKKVIQIAPAVFEWRGTSTDWIDARDLTLPLLQGIPAHQYLHNQLRDDATIEIAVMEPRPAWLQRMLDAETSNNRQPTTDNGQQG